MTHNFFLLLLKITKFWFHFNNNIKMKLEKDNIEYSIFYFNFLFYFQ